MIIKKISTVLVSTLLSITYAQVTVDGYAYLENQTNHSGIKVKFIAQSGTASTDSVYTNSNGSYSIAVSIGIYQIIFSKDGFLEHLYYEEPMLAQNVTLNDVTLETEGVIGNVSGTWISDSIYVIKGDITIQNGDTLIIQPGTEIKFHSDYSFDIYGLLLAEGMQGDSIVFTSNRLVKDKGDWGGVYFNAESDDNSILSYCLIEYGGSGGNGLIKFQNSGPTIQNCSIRESAGNGVIIRGQSLTIENLKCEPDIVNCTITAIENYAIYSESSNPLIKDNYLARGIFIKDCSGAIEGNSIYGGVSILGSSYMIVLERNSIFGEIFCSNYSTPIIRNNFLNSNYSNISCRSNSSPVIEYNIITGGAFCGIQVGEQSSPRITNNTIYNSGYGILGAFNHTESMTINMNIITENVSGIQFTNNSPQNEISHNLVWGNTNQNFQNVSIPWIGDLITINANGDSIDAYYNLSQDPLFVTTDINSEGFLHLTGISPAIDAGQPDSLDPDGTIRDLGAIYFNPDDIPEPNIFNLNNSSAI